MGIVELTGARKKDASHVELLMHHMWSFLHAPMHHGGFNDIFLHARVVMAVVRIHNKSSELAMMMVVI